MDFKKYLKETAKKLDREAGKILQEELKKAEKTDKKLVPLITAFIKSCRGGKGIRGALVILGYEMVNSKFKSKQSLRSKDLQKSKVKEIIKVAAAYEILHSAILVHDDIIDRSLIRRDKPALHKILGNNHYGLSQAISLADYGFFLSYKIISGSQFPPEQKASALKLYSQVMIETAWGEMLDLESTDPLIVATLKTARYTIAGPLQMGAVLGGAGQDIVRAIGEAGESLGIAFQIQDDILDKEDGIWGGREKAKEMAEEYKIKAEKMLPEVTKDPKMSKILEQMAEYLVERKN